MKSINISDRYKMLLDQEEYEDQLPEMNRAEYVIWYLNSRVDGVRIGFKVVER